MVDRGRADRRATVRAQGRAAGVEVDDGRAAGQRAGEPRARIAEVGSEHVLEAKHVAIKRARRVQVVGLDCDVKQSADQHVVILSLKLSETPIGRRPAGAQALRSAPATSAARPGPR